MSDTPNWRSRLPGARLPSPGLTKALIAGFEGVRLSVEEAEDSLVAAADRLAPLRAPWAREAFNILAISGGAAGGAYGAGILVGMTRAGRRPDFAIVTGVSTGALIAPFAFLGPSWDDRLTDAYTGGHASDLLGLGKLAPGSGAIFRAESLDRLVGKFIDAEMLAAIAAEHAKGRRLLVATTDLDRQRTVIWDMGEIARHGGEEALALFRTVLVASGSLPGIFPPKRIVCQADGVLYEEMHVDGGVTTPLFLMPEALLRWRKLGQRLARSQVYAIVNTVLDQAPRTTQNNIAAILIRSFDTMLRFSYRHAIEVTAAFCARHRLPFSVATIPDPGEAFSMMSFDTVSMRRNFDNAVERAMGDNLWSTPVAEPSVAAGLLQSLKMRPDRAGAVPRDADKSAAIAPDPE
ncbi:MAG: patatin [Caulobacteraceae bacterium]|nr:patatin-like phospholipase family protein [Caulobacter sp.]RYF89517.1 MAG: patatin [Caulobacteraceae bacterium]